MEADEFLKAAQSPVEWLKKSVALRHSAEELWEAFVLAMLHWGAYVKSGEPDEKNEADFDRAAGILDAAKLLYGLSLETAFKARIIETEPTSIEFRMTADGAGKIKHAEIKEFGASLGAGHNLEYLAERAGLFESGDAAVFGRESDLRAIREILRHLTEVVVWSGRYPVPTKSGDRHRLPADLPARMFGHYIRDWIDVVLDEYQGDNWTSAVHMDTGANTVDRIDAERAPNAPPSSNRLLKKQL